MPETADGRPGYRTVRCACRRCGAHVIVKAGFVLAGNCGNCDSYDLVRLDEEG